MTEYAPIQEGSRKLTTRLREKFWNGGTVGGVQLPAGVVLTSSEFAEVVSMEADVILLRKENQKLRVALDAALTEGS